MLYFHCNLDTADCYEKWPRKVRGEHMKRVLFKKRIDLDKKTKTFSIDTKTEDQQSKTRVKKSFTYAIDWAKEDNPRSRRPLVFIRKTFDTKRGVEEFGFHVKGYFFVTQESELVKVLFHHTLDIKIRWKGKELVPKDVESLI